MNTAKVKISLLASLTLLLYFHLTAQEHFIVFGKMKLEKGNLDGKIELIKNGTRQRTLSADRNGKFEFELDLHSDYVISFSQDEYVTKKIAFNTTIPQGREEFGFAPFEFQVTLFKQYEGVNFVVFNQPVGRIHFNSQIDDFDYDTDYTKSIQQRLAEIEKEVEEKMKEEEKAEKQKPRKEEPPPPQPAIKEETIVKREDPPTTPKRRYVPPDPPPPRKKSTNLVVMHAYTVGELGYPNLSAYGFINFGDGTGIREITKEQFEEYRKTYR